MVSPGFFPDTKCSQRCFFLFNRRTAKLSQPCFTWVFPNHVLFHLRFSRWNATISAMFFCFHDFSLFARTSLVSMGVWCQFMGVSSPSGCITSTRAAAFRRAGRGGLVSLSLTLSFFFLCLSDFLYPFFFFFRFSSVSLSLSLFFLSLSPSLLLSLTLPRPRPVPLPLPLSLPLSLSVSFTLSPFRSQG